MLLHTNHPKESYMGIAFKLRREHIYPSSCEKMTVRLMAQVMNASKHQRITYHIYIKIVLGILSFSGQII
jgi:hypothetical protein